MHNKRKVNFMVQLGNYDKASTSTSDIDSIIYKETDMHTLKQIYLGQIPIINSLKHNKKK